MQQQVFFLCTTSLLHCGRSAMENRKIAGFSCKIKCFLPWFFSSSFDPEKHNKLVKIPISVKCKLSRFGSLASLNSWFLSKTMKSVARILRPEKLVTRSEKILWKEEWEKKSLLNNKVLGHGDFFCESQFDSCGAVFGHPTGEFKACLHLWQMCSKPYFTPSQPSKFCTSASSVHKSSLVPSAISDDFEKKVEQKGSILTPTLDFFFP